MKLLLSACLLLCLGSSLAAPAPTNPKLPMEWPEKMEGRMSISVGMVPLVGNWTLGFLSEATIHFDFKNSKIAVIQEVNTGVYKSRVNVVEDLATKKMYIIELERKKCSIYPLAGLMSVRLPEDQPQDSGKPRTIGWEKDTVDLVMTDHEIANPPMIVKEYKTKSSLPVSVQFIGTFNTVKMVQGQIFSDLVKGIKDTSVFNIPDYCNSPSMYEASVAGLNSVVAAHIARRTMYV